MKDKGEVFARLIHIADRNNIQVKLCQLLASDGRLKDDRIALRSAMGIDDINYSLAHELAHYYLHFDKGNTISSEKHADYEEQADRAAKMLLDALAV